MKTYIKCVELYPSTATSEVLLGRDTETETERERESARERSIPSW